MANDASKMITTLLTAGPDAAIQANREQRKIWADWLEDIIDMLGEIGEEIDFEKREIFISEQLSLAPAFKLNAFISVSSSMRIASIDRVDASGGLGLSLGLLQISGSFGMSQQNSSESTLQARAEYTLTNNNELSLSDYLGSLGVKTSDPTELQNAVTILRSPEPED